MSKNRVEKVVNTNVKTFVSKTTYKHLGSLHNPKSHGNWSKGAGMYGGAKKLVAQTRARLANALGKGASAAGRIAGGARRAAGQVSSAAGRIAGSARRAAGQASGAAKRIVESAANLVGRAERAREERRRDAVAATQPRGSLKLSGQLPDMRRMAGKVAQRVRDKITEAGGAKKKVTDFASKVAQRVRDKITDAGGAKRKVTDFAKNIAQRVRDRVTDVGGTMRGKKVPPATAKVPQLKPKLIRLPNGRFANPPQTRLEKLQQLAKKVGQGVKDKITKVGETMRGKKVPKTTGTTAQQKPSTSTSSPSRMQKLRDLAKRIGQSIKDRVSSLGNTAQGKKIVADANARIDTSRNTADNGGIPSSALGRGLRRPQLRPGGMGRPVIKPGLVPRPQLRPKPGALPKPKPDPNNPWYDVTPDNGKPSSNGLGSRLTPSAAVKLALTAALLIGGVSLAGGVGGAISGGASAVASVFGIGTDANATEEEKKKAATATTKEIRAIVAKNVANSLRARS